VKNKESEEFKVEAVAGPKYIERQSMYLVQSKDCAEK
jgi:hypothetical protein